MPRTTRNLIRTAAGLLAAGLLAAVAFAFVAPVEQDNTPRPLPVPSSIELAAEPSATSVVKAPVRRLPEILSARSDHDLAVFPAPEDSEPALVLPSRTSFGSPLVLLVTAVGDGDDDNWVQVALPGRPNGRTGWVKRSDVQLHEVLHRVIVDREAKQLTVSSPDGRELLRTPVAIGEPQNPTPTGRFFLTDKLQSADPNGPYGPFALGTSARSDVLTEFAGGDGQVGIHGTNDPSSIGRAASHGCVRVPNEVAVQLSEMLALGTPVEIR